MFLGMIKVLSSLYEKYENVGIIQERFLLQEKCLKSSATSHCLQILSAAGLRKSLGSVTGRRLSLLECPALFAPVFRRENYEQNAEQGPERVAQSWHPKSDRGRCQTGNSSAVAMHRRVTFAPGVQGSFVPSRVAHTIYS